MDERLISLNDAATLSGLSPSHLRLLARSKKLRAQRMGRDWFTTAEAVADYLGNIELRSKDPQKYKRP